MDLIHFIIFACVVYLAIVAGRLSKNNDMRRRFESIEEPGQSFRTVGDVINCILQLRDSVEDLEYEKIALQNSLNTAIAAREKLEKDYKALLSQLREKREECEEQETNISNLRDKNKELVERINKCSCKFDEWMQKLWEFASAINNNACEQRDKQGDYCFFMKKAGHKLIYATELLNKSHLLSIGRVEVQKNGSLKYSEGSRSLGNYASKENCGWLNAINPMCVLPQMNPRESRPIALITDYKNYQNLSKIFSEVLKSSDNVVTESANMLDYMVDIKSKFEKLKS